MNFFQFLKSLDDLLFEVVSWLVFYPITLWRSLRHPLAMMDYAVRELSESVERRFDDVVSPPIQLLLTVLLAHGIELSTVGQTTLIDRTDGLAGLISDNTSLILMRLIAFASFPLIFALVTLVLKRQHVTRSHLEPAFFAQTFACAPFALATSIATTLVQIETDLARIAGVAIGVVSVAGFLSVETAWFRTRLSLSLLRAIGVVLVAYAIAVTLILTVGWAVTGGR